MFSKNTCWASVHILFALLLIIIFIRFIHNLSSSTLTLVEGWGRDHFHGAGIAPSALHTSTLGCMTYSRATTQIANKDIITTCNFNHPPIVRCVMVLYVIKCDGFIMFWNVMVVSWPMYVSQVPTVTSFRNWSSFKSFTVLPLRYFMV